MNVLAAPLPIRVLVVDDEPAVADSLRLLLESLGAVAKNESNAQRVEAAIEQFKPDLVLCDLRMPRRDGRSVLESIRRQPTPPRVVLMSAYGSLDTAREALSWGADDYVCKPITAVELKRILELARVTAPQGDIMAAPAPAAARFGLMVGASPAMRHVFQMIERIAPFSTTVLICGESGVGKELAARELHQRSSRVNGPFIPVNCGAIPEALLESELFGYKKGAFTSADQDRQGLIAQANGGTLFLDEIGDLPLLLQVKLLRVIQEGQVQPLGANKPVKVDVRWLTATLVDLEEAVKAGDFRQDLYFRLNVLRLDLPPLRARSGDLLYLVGETLHRLNQRYGKQVERLEAAAFARLQAYHWPGNIRELENLLERAYIMASGAAITDEGLRGLISKVEAKLLANGGESLSIKKQTRRLEAELIQRALLQTGGNRTHAAKLLEISPRALIYKIREYGLE